MHFYMQDGTTCLLIFICLGRNRRGKCVKKFLLDKYYIKRYPTSTVTTCTVGGSNNSVLVTYGCPISLHIFVHMNAKKSETDADWNRQLGRPKVKKKFDNVPACPVWYLVPVWPCNPRQQIVIGPDAVSTWLKIVFPFMPPKMNMKSYYVFRKMFSEQNVLKIFLVYYCEE